MKSLLYGLPIAIAAVLAPALARADISFVVSIAPPAIPVYVQPPIPGDGYIWTPGYWSWNDDDEDYYWVPGAWVVAPYVGALWTPGYWAASGGRYAWHEGYWGNRIGFYGGVNYGYGYGGAGYQGGYWDHGEFRYNRAVNNITTTNVRNVYNTAVSNSNNVSNVRGSYGGGVSGGMHVQPSSSAQPYGTRMPYYQPAAQPVQRALQPQYQQPATQWQRPLERYAPQEHAQQQVLAHAQPMPLPVPMPATAQAAFVRQPLTSRAPTMERGAPLEAARPVQVHQGHSNERDVRER